MELKYEELNGAADWFQKKKQELERGAPKKASGNQGSGNYSSSHYNHLPLHHQWKPPRIDQTKYQVDEESYPNQMKVQDLNAREDVNESSRRLSRKD